MKAKTTAILISMTFEEDSPLISERGKGETDLGKCLGKQVSSARHKEERKALEGEEKFGVVKVGLRVFGRC